MDCQIATEHLGALVDGELPSALREEVQSHLEQCEHCRAEYEETRRFADRLAAPVEASVPPELWDSIEARLDAARNQVVTRHISFWRRPPALAASVAFLIGLGILATSLIGPGSSTAQAASIDFSLLLDGLEADVAAAVDRFLDSYDAKPIPPGETHAYAPDLEFAVPQELPGGFQLQQAYKLRFLDKPGIAARYARGDELLMTLVHPPLRMGGFGAYQDAPCIIGERHGHQVEVGPWRLIHLKAPTTCHCILSKLDLATEMPAVLSEIAPNLPAGTTMSH